MTDIVKQIATLKASGQNENLLTALIDTITRHGSTADAEAFLSLFIQSKEAQLLKPLQAHGNAQIAQTLFNHSIENGKLKEDFPPQTLLALGYLQHAQTETVLLAYYKGLFNKQLDWDLHVAICLALLNYDCTGYEKVIQEEIEKCLSASLFPEMIPSLAVKTGDDTMLEKLYHHGCTKASSDASAGLLLGIAMFGQKGKELFKKAIYNPNWEAGSTATGNRTYTMMGLAYLQISLAEMFEDMKQLHKDGGNGLPQHLFLLESMLEAKLAGGGMFLVRCIPPHAETYAAVYEALFAPADGNSIFTYIEQVQVTVWKDLLVQSFERLQELYALQMAHQTELEFLKGKMFQKAFDSEQALPNQ